MDSTLGLNNISRPAFNTCHIDVGNKNFSKYMFEITIPDRIWGSPNQTYSRFSSPPFTLYIEYYKTRATLKICKTKLVSYRYNIFYCKHDFKEVRLLTTEALLSFLLYPLNYERCGRLVYDTNKTPFGSISLSDYKRYLHIKFLKNFKEFLTSSSLATKRVEGNYKKLSDSLDRRADYYSKIIKTLKQF